LPRREAHVKRHYGLHRLSAIPLAPCLDVHLLHLELYFICSTQLFDTDHKTTSDSSIIRRFSWYEPVYFNADEPAFPSKSPEVLGHFVGFSETVGHAMTLQILSAATLKIFHRSEVRSALNSNAPNLRADLCNGEIDNPSHH
jgi:hypothetical protein